MFGYKESYASELLSTIDREGALVPSLYFMRILAAKAMGLNDIEFIIHHLLPNVISPIIVAATLAIADEYCSVYESDGVDITKVDKDSKRQSIIPLYKLDTKWMVTRKMKSIEGIQYAKNLEAIELSECEISDITPLKDLKKIKYIELDRNRITDVSPLANLTELEHLKLYNNLIRDISPLKTLTKLNYLDVHFNVDNDGSNGITNADVVRNMPELDTLDLSANHITNVDAIVGLNKLRILDFSGNNVSDYANIKDKVFEMFSKQLDEYNNPERVSCGFFGQKLNVNQKVAIPATGGEFTFNSPYSGLDELAEMFELNTFFLMCNPSYVSNGMLDATEIGELGEGDKIIEEMIESIEYNSENKTFTVKVKPNTTTEKKNLKIDVNATTGELGFILTGIEINQETQSEETKTEGKPETKPEGNPETKPETKPEGNPETKPVSPVASQNKKASNEKISALPKTGGVSEGMSILLGSLVTAIGAIMLLSKKRN